MTDPRPVRFMKEVRPNHWVIGCRVCGKRSRRAFDSALECHEYWRDHAKTTLHVQNADPNHFSSSDADGVALREIFRSAGLMPKRPDSIPRTDDSDQAGDPPSSGV